MIFPAPCLAPQLPSHVLLRPRAAYRGRTAVRRRAMGHVGRQACVGALAAVVAALLQAFSEPVLNRVAVKRMGIGEAVREVRLVDILRFFRTVLATQLGGNGLSFTFS